MLVNRFIKKRGFLETQEVQKIAKVPKGEGFCVNVRKISLYKDY